MKLRFPGVGAHATVTISAWRGLVASRVLESSRKAREEGVERWLDVCEHEGRDGSRSSVASDARRLQRLRLDRLDPTWLRRIPGAVGDELIVEGLQVSLSPADTEGASDGRGGIVQDREI